MRCRTANAMLQENSQNDEVYLSFGDSLLDEATGGGVLRKGITEISGEAGSGKTQFCLTLSIQSQLQKRRRSCLTQQSKSAYLCCGEGEFPIQRLSQVATALEQPHNGLSKHTLLDGVLIEKCHTLEDILDSVLHKLPDMCRQDHVSFLCIDSIGGLARNEYDVSEKDQMFERTTILFKLSQSLKWLSDTFGVCIVVVNQVSSSFTPESNHTNPSSLWGNSHPNRISIGRDGMLLAGGSITPALGLAWSHCVNTRMILSRQSIALRRNNTQEYEDLNENSNENLTRNEISVHQQTGGSCEGGFTASSNPPPASSSSSVRHLFLQFSPHAPMTVTEYRITQRGLEGVFYYNYPG